MSKNRIILLILSALMLGVLATSALAQDAASRSIIARLRAVDLATGRIVVADRVVNIAGAQIVADTNGLQQGDYVQLQLTTAADGSVIVQSVTEIAAQNGTVSGVVQALDASTVTINGAPYSLTYAIIDREGTLTVGRPARIEFIEVNGQRLALEVEFDDDNGSNNTSNNSSNNTSNNTSSNSGGNRPGSSTGSSANCQPPANWYRYNLRFGDTLSALAAVTGVSVEDLMFANCITDPRGLLAGQAIFVPVSNINPDRLNAVMQQNNRRGSDRWDDLFDDRWDDDDDDDRWDDRDDDDWDDRWDDDDDDDWDDDNDDDDDWDDDNDDDDWGDDDDD